jgi:hypothetical protein
VSALSDLMLAAGAGVAVELSVQQPMIKAGHPDT